MINPRNNGRYTKGKIALIALAELLQRGLLYRAADFKKRFQVIENTIELQIRLKALCKDAVSRLQLN